MSHEPEQFDDPALRGALQRAFGGENADAALRERVAAALANPPAQRDGRRWLMAMAAGVLLVFGAGLVAMHVVQRHRAAEEAVDHQRESQEFLADNRALFDAMAVAAQVSIGGTAGTAQRVRTELTEKLGHAVPLPDLSAKGWQLVDAWTGQLGATPAGMVEFRKGEQRVTLVTVAASALAKDEEGEDYDVVVLGRPIAGYVKAGALNCVVGGQGASADEVAMLRDVLRGS